MEEHALLAQGSYVADQILDGSRCDLSNGTPEYADTGQDEVELLKKGKPKAAQNKPKAAGKKAARGKR